jgi:hypothetical protein
MARTLTNVVPDLYEALDTVSRELVGFIPAVQASMSAERAAKDQVVYSPATAALSAADTTPAVTPPDTGDNTVVGVAVTISKSRHVAVRVSGEQNRALNTGPGFSSILAQEFAQAMRTLVNEVESDIGGEYVRASRAYGTAGTAPFGSSPALSDAFAMQKILDDNGAPMGDRQLVINSAAALSLGSLTALTNVNQAGDADLLRRGMLTELAGFSVRKSAGVKRHTPGTGAATYAVDLVAGYAAGSTAIHIDTGTGTMVAGDVLSNTQSGRDANKYVVKTGCAGDADQDIVLASPGLQVAWVNNDTLGLAAAYNANLAFQRGAIVLATRAPAMPDLGDVAADSMIVTDPVSGLSFEVRMYPQFQQMQYLVMLAWGVKCIKPEHCAILLG